jgi:hypothetical protein
MALDTYLVVFYHFDAHSLHKLELKYLGGITAVTFIPALVFLFIHSPEKGPIYGSEIIWCSVSPHWVLIRLILYYIPVWCVLIPIYSARDFSHMPFFQQDNDSDCPGYLLPHWDRDY